MNSNQKIVQIIAEKFNISFIKFHFKMLNIIIFYNLGIGTFLPDFGAIASNE